jgi:AcrR family transcriptional regulator
MAPKVKGDGRATRWDTHRDQRRGELVQAAVRAIDQHGPDVTIADIAAEAGVSKPVLYRYFADKDELHAAVGMWGADEVLAGMIPALQSDAPVQERVARAVDAYLTTLEEHPQVFLLLVRHRGSDPLLAARQPSPRRSAACSVTRCGSSTWMPPVRSPGPRACSGSGSRPASGGSNARP